MIENPEFDALLEEVLREGSHIEPGAGFEERVIAGIRSRAASRKRSMLVALAATGALAAGMALWFNVGAWEGRQSATPDTASLGTVRSKVNRPDNRPDNRPAKEERSSKNEKVRPSRAVGHHFTESAREESSRSLSPESSPIQGDILRTSPIAIVPLKIESIELAQLKNQRTNEGKPNEDEIQETTWSVVLVCDSRCIDRRMGAGSRASSE